MGNPLIEDYLRWLIPQIRDEQTTTEYWDLCTIMFDKDAVWSVPNDHNRLVDGLDLRREFSYHKRVPKDELDRIGPCTFLELLIALSRRLAFVVGGEAPGWAWQLICNLELDRMSDPLSHFKSRKVNQILDTVLERTYAPDGSGGFFPLGFPEEDQTKKELWYQMAAYIDELHPEHH
jgi:hypothetical protein